MIKDRGSIKWTSLTLPEHVKLLREFDKSFYKMEKPILDEQLLEKINNTICEAMEFNKELVFTYYENGDIKLYIGNIHYLDEIKKEVRILGFHQEIFILKIEDILRVDIS
ncbi:hypothetical protein WQ54_15225 [Bacillus sp. SA1-12]|uniref:YolD-like family protein n=1 Tax=Bacillus sp. SA1-12 TaxID=1455638 RepID=UPI000625211E|nr:YolD-like family protein [Bacillus sp. SA1-12]KKI91373.1 hypothetical protein WQ54_15225 [Bacillus sp. SA1-12]